MSDCYLNIALAEDIDEQACPAGLLPSLLDATSDQWSGWCKCMKWWMEGPAFDAEDVANAWGDHLTPNDEPRILFATMPNHG